MDCDFCDKNKPVLEFLFGHLGKSVIFRICAGCCGLEDPTEGVPVSALIYELQAKADAKAEVKP